MPEIITDSIEATNTNIRTFVATRALSKAVPVSTLQLTVLALLGTVSMLFAGFASAYLVRRAGTDWHHVPLPGILWFNSILLLTSSVTIEAARTAQRRGWLGGTRPWVAGSEILGLAFLAGQVVAWRQLAAQGVYLPSNPYSSFFYTLTALHGLHLLGGVLALSYLLWRISRSNGVRIDPDVLDSCATYWHFVDGLWILLYFLLLVY